MPDWKIEFEPKAVDDLKSLDKPVRKRILQRLEWLGINFSQVTPLPLSGEWKGFFKLRVGDWRVVYKIDDDKKILIIAYIDSRDKIYKRK